jgi:hypothetical protein
LIDPADVHNDEIFEVKSLVGQYSFRLKQIQNVTIRIKVWQTKESYGGDRFTFSTSHYIHTPTQIDAYLTSSPYASSEEWAITLAIHGIVDFYTDAIKKGHTPTSKWLIPNEDFDEE